MLRAARAAAERSRELGEALGAEDQPPAEMNNARQATSTNDLTGNSR
jgi:hypothetical protein